MIAFILSWLLFTDPPLNKFEQMRNDFQSVLISSEKTAGFISKYKQQKEVLSRAYLAAAEAMLAEVVFNPYSKYRHFSNGTEQLDALIKQNQQNIEMRFLRMMIQIEAPSFLGYKNEINEDLNAFCAYFSIYEGCGAEYKKYMKSILIGMMSESPNYCVRLNKLEA